MKEFFLKNKPIKIENYELKGYYIDYIYEYKLQEHDLVLSHYETYAILDNIKTGERDLLKVDVSYSLQRSKDYLKKYEEDIINEVKNYVKQKVFEGFKQLREMGKELEKEGKLEELTNILEKREEY